MIELAVFDMAGTTIDDRGAVYTALEDAVRSTGASVAADDLQAWMGTEKSRAIRALMPLGGVEATDQLVGDAFEFFRARLDELYSAEPPVAFAGVPDALAELRSRGIRVALTTGFTADVALPLLDALGWSVAADALSDRSSAAGEASSLDLSFTVDAVVTASDVRSGRPAPYLIQHAMETLGVTDVRRVLSAGDTVVDLQSARNAGVLAVGVLTGALGREALEAVDHDYVLDGVRDVPGLAETRRERG